MPRLTSFEARSILTRAIGNPFRDFHALSSSEVDALLSEADARRYRSPRNANGSRGRTFYQYLRRIGDKA